jgi:hypothetical protein
MPSQLLAEREEERVARGIAGQVWLTWSRERWVDDAKGQMGKWAKGQNLEMDVRNSHSPSHA